MSWNIGDDRKPFLKLRSKLGFYHIVLTTLKAFPEKPRLTVVEMQLLLDIEKTDSKRVSLPKWTILNGRKKIM